MDNPLPNSNPSSMDENKLKKWMISRIDLYLKTTIDVFLNDVKRLEKNSDTISSSYRRKRNGVLTSLGIILTVVLGINATNAIEQLQFYIILTVLGVAALITLLISDLYMKIIEDVFVNLVNSINENIENLAYSQGYITTKVFILSNVTVSFIKNYHNFTQLLSLAILVSISKTFSNLANRYSKIPQLKTLLNKEAKSFLEHTDLIPQYYDKLDRSQEFPRDLLAFIDKALEKFHNVK